MSNGTNIMAIDAGNTRIKTAHFYGSDLLEVNRFNLEEQKTLESLITDSNPEIIVYSSVLNDDLAAIIRSMHSQVFVINTELKFPMGMGYDTPETLGIDRVCNAAFVYSNLETDIGVCIDIGTCIKFDVISKTEGYLGGSIGPGINLRYKSLHAFTDKLPLIANNSPIDLVGTSTEKSIHSGVINGMNAEVNGLINAYEMRFEDLTFFVTGGDASAFDIHSKNDIFADENLTLRGMIEIYNCNV